VNKRLLGSVLIVLGVAVAGCGGEGGNKAKDGGSGGAGGGAGTAGSSGGGGGGSSGGGPAVDGGSCSFTACGGDIVGTWHIVDACGLLAAASCAPAAGVTVEHVSSMATYTFGSDGSFTAAFSGAYEETYRYPFSCLAGLTDGGTGQICADYQNRIQALLAQVDAGVVGATYACTMDGNQACVCSEAYSFPSPATQTGSYTVAGDQLTITSSASSADAGASGMSAPEVAAYCVAGSKLTLHVTGNDGASDFVMTFTR
jgi:hypothetical protein